MITPRTPSALFFLLLQPAQAYLGPTPCNPSHKPLPFRPTLSGYSTFSHLLFDLTSLSSTFRSGLPIHDSQLTFSICPGSVIDLDDSTLPLSFIPIRVPRVTIQCGTGKRGTKPCIIRGGGKRSPHKSEWNTNRANSYKDGGHAILGGGNVAQIYIYGEEAYEVTLRGLTMDNEVTRGEIEMYGAFVQEFGSEALWVDDDDLLVGDGMVSSVNDYGYGSGTAVGSSAVSSSGSGVDSSSSTVADKDEATSVPQGSNVGLSPSGSNSAAGIANDYGFGTGAVNSNPVGNAGSGANSASSFVTAGKDESKPGSGSESTVVVISSNANGKGTTSSSGTDADSDSKDTGGAKQMFQESTSSLPVSYSTKESQNGKRNLQTDAFDTFETFGLETPTIETTNAFDTSNTLTGDKVEAMDAIQPAQRYASIAVRGGGYGDDPGPRIITIEDCEFKAHRGYAVLVSPGIELPEIPVAPKIDMPEQPGSGEPHNYGNTGYNMNQNGLNRELNLLDGDAKFISQQGSIKYFDNSAGVNYLDGRRVKIVNSEFTNNHAAGDQVAGLITSAYSLTMSNCKFTENSAKSMVYVYNNQALIDNTIFAQNTVQAATVVMKSPDGSEPLGEEESPHHLVERSCFLGSKVGMSNVLVTDIVNTGFAQRDNHATGTEFSWESKCEGAAAEEDGEDCLETGLCDGTCVEFISERCMAENMDESNQQDFGGFFMWNAAGVRGVWSYTLFGLLMGAIALNGL